MNYYHKSLVLMLATAPLFAVATPVAYAQAMAPSMPASMIAGKGETKTNSINSGSRSALSLGINSNLGTNVSVSAQNGYTSNASSVLAISAGSFTSSFGKTGSVEADIRNIRTEGAQSGSVSGTNYSINPTNATTAQGQATVKGMASEADIRLDPKTSSQALAGQTSTTNTVAGTSNASGGQNMATTMNVDISNTSFSQSFSQSF